jgi:exodeoxyribonuclease X
MYEAIILDTETTDKENCEVIELAWRAQPFDVVAGNANWARFSPQRAIKFGAMSTHHILPSELVGLEPAARAPFVVPKAEYWIGHNIDFDWRALGELPVRRICTLAMARVLWPQCDSHNLTALTYYHDGCTEETRERVRNAHGALADVVLCLNLFERIMQEKGFTTISEVWAFSEDCRIPRTMTFGKFKDQPVAAVDRGWANWYYRQADTDPYLIEALRREGKL